MRHMKLLDSHSMTIAQEGKTGRSTNCRLTRKPDINPTNPTLAEPDTNPTNTPLKGQE